LTAVILAKVSGREVPRATNVMAVTGLGIPITQPNISAHYPTRAVTPPIKQSAITNAGYPFPQVTGGTAAKINFQGIWQK